MIPTAFRTSSGTDACVITEGNSARDSKPPKDSARVKTCKKSGNHNLLDFEFRRTFRFETGALEPGDCDCELPEIGVVAITWPRDFAYTTTLS